MGATSASETLTNHPQTETGSVVNSLSRENVTESLKTQPVGKLGFPWKPLALLHFRGAPPRIGRIGRPSDARPTRQNARTSLPPGVAAARSESTSYSWVGLRGLLEGGGQGSALASSESEPDAETRPPTEATTWVRTTAVSCERASRRGSSRCVPKLIPRTSNFTMYFFSRRWEGGREVGGARSPAPAHGGSQELACDMAPKVA